MTREHQFIPELIVRNGHAALKFYKDVFGAEEVDRMMTSDGKKLVHGELTLDGHKFFVCDELDAKEGGTCKSPQTLGRNLRPRHYSCRRRRPSMAWPPGPRR
jgi:uncharacterized glyoxalase superfamily protein PhnB